MTETNDFFPGEPFPMDGNWCGFALALSFPLRQDSAREQLLSSLWAVADLLHPAPQAEPTVWLLTDNLYKDDAILQVSRNGALWEPSHGLGRWPDQPPPRMIKRSDLLDLEWGSKARLPYHRVIRLDARGETLHAAWTTMFGLGSTILTLTPGGSSAMLQESREALTGDITDESFQDFPFYFPLLSLPTLRGTSAPTLDRWLGPTDFYLRESEEDGALLMACRSEPTRFLQALRQHGLISPEWHTMPGR